MTANSTPKSFDAVLDTIRTLLEVVEAHGIADRLAAAHARELAEQQAIIEALRKDVAKEKSAADHWFSEANRDHNNLLRAEAAESELAAPRIQWAEQ